MYICNECGNEDEDSSFYYDFENIPNDVKSGIFNLEE